MKAAENPVAIKALLALADAEFLVKLVSAFGEPGVTYCMFVWCPIRSLPRFSFFFIAARLAAARSSGVISDDVRYPFQGTRQSTYISNGGMKR
jgi:hypothetical protein